MSIEEKRARKKTMGNNADVLQDDSEYDSMINVEFTMKELNNALSKCGKATPGKDEIQ